MARKKANPNAAQQEYEPTPDERAAIAKHLARRAASPAVRLKVLNGKSSVISPDHPNEAIGSQLLMDALGTADPDFVTCLIGQLANASTQGRQIDERGLNFMLSVVKGIKPEDQIEAMLAAQMAAVHLAIMTFARRLAHVENIPQQDSAERALNKLARTYATQMEALKRYRTGGEQKVTVQHVSVSEGGQAIVGNVTQAARNNQAAVSSHASNDLRIPPITNVGEPVATPVPVKRKSSK